MTTYPGIYAVPGAMWPGAIWPGDSVTSTPVTVEVFLGTEILIYPQYLDVVAGHTLVASPGGSYQIQVASGYPGVTAVPPGDGRWQASQQMMMAAAEDGLQAADSRVVTAEDGAQAEPAELDPIFEAIAKRLERMREQADELEAARLNPPRTGPRRKNCQRRKNWQAPQTGTCQEIGGGAGGGY